MLAPLVAVALSLALLAPLVRAAAWRVPVGLMSVRMVLASVFGTAFVTSVGGMLAAGLFALVPALRPADPAPVVAAAGGVLGAARVLGGAFRLRRLRGALLLAHRLREPEIRDDCRTALQALLTNARPDRPDAGHRAYATLVLLVTPPMTQAGFWNDAETLLEELPPAAIDDRQRALRAQALATCRLQQGNVSGAQEALDALVRPVPDPSVEQWLQTTEALLLAVEGRADEALRIVGPDERLSDPLLRGSRRVVRAHAYAARGESDRAMEELRAVRREVGEAGLDRALRPTGPATDLARDVSREPDLAPSSD